MANPIKLGMVGIGRAGWGMHCTEIEDKKDMFEIVAACDILPERCEKMKERYNCRTYHDIHDLVKDPDVEIVDIATRSCDHYMHAKLALEAGKDVLLEKPFCETYAEACALCELAESLGRKIYARHNRRFEAAFNTIREIQQSKLLGDIYEIHITRNSYQRRDDWQTLSEFGGGQLLNWGPHIIDQSLQFLDEKAQVIASDLKHVTAGGDCEDHLSILFKGENGTVVSMQISGGIAVKCPDYEAFGTKGSLRVYGNTMQLKYLDPNIKLDPVVSDPGTPGQTFGSTGTFANAKTLTWLEEERECKYYGDNEDLSIIWKSLYEDYRDIAPYAIKQEEALNVIKVIDMVKKGTKFERPSRWLK